VTDEESEEEKDKLR